MTLTATQTNNPINTNFLQDVGTGFRTNTRGYATLQQLVGDGTIEFAFEQNTADNVAAAAGLSFAIYPHAVRSSLSAIHLIAFGFCVRATEDSNKVFVKALNTYIDTTVLYSPTLRMRIERIGNVVNFYTVVGSVATLRHTITSATPLPNVSNFILLSGKNGCRISNVFISGVTQQPEVLDLTKNVYIPFEGDLNFSNTQPRIAVLMNAGEGFTWHFPDGTTSQEATPNKTLPANTFTTLIRLEVPSGVTAIRDLTIPLLRRDGRITPPDLGQLTSLRNLKFITRTPTTPGFEADQRKFLVFTSQLRLPSSVESVIFEPISDEQTGNQGTANETRLSPLLLPEEFSFANLTSLRDLRLGFMQDPQASRKYQSGVAAYARFPNLTGCTSLQTVLLETHYFGGESTVPANTNPHFFTNIIPITYLTNLVNLTSIRILERGFGIPYGDAFVTSFIVGLGRLIGNRTTPVLTARIGNPSNNATVTGAILSFAANAPAGSSSIQVTTTTGLSVGDRLHLEDGAVNSLNSTPIIASISGTANPFTITFQAGFTLQNSYTAATGRVLNLESGLGSTRRLRLLGHIIQVAPTTI